MSDARARLAAARPAAGGKVSLADFEEFGAVRLPGDAEEPIFPQPLRDTLQNWMFELNSAKALAAMGVGPRQRAMLEGPPGTGKTSTCHYLAARLGLPLVVVEVPGLIAGYIGHTGLKIGKLFDLARKMDVVLFLDEIDSVAGKRGAGNRSADQDNNVVALLQMIDRHPGLLLAATNRGDMLDSAVWRRFQLQIHIGMPDDDAGFAIVKRYLAPLAVPDDAIEVIWSTVQGLAPAVIKEVMEGVRRDVVLAERLKLPIGAHETFDRVSRGIRPSEEFAIPLLWADPTLALDAISEIAWPPRLLTQAG